VANIAVFHISTNIYLETLNIYNNIETSYKTPYIINDNDDLGKLRTIVLAIKNIYNLKIDFIRMKKVFPEHIKVFNKTHTYVIGFLNLEANQFTSRLKNFNSAVANDKNTKFRLFRDIRSPKVKSKKTIQEKQKLNNSENGRFVDMDKNNRIIFETFYEVISAYDNKDTDFKLTELTESLTKNEFDQLFTNLILKFKFLRDYELKDWEDKKEYNKFLSFLIEFDYDEVFKNI